jgi:hypothetical protein
MAAALGFPTSAAAARAGADGSGRHGPAAAER